MKMAVLGRGDSLSKYKDHSHSYENICIVNNFNREIELIGMNHFKGKNIKHVVGRGPNNLKPFLYKELDIREVQSNCLKIKQFGSTSKYVVKVVPLGKHMKDRGFPPLDWDTYLKHKDDFDNYKELVSFISDNYSNEIKSRMAKRNNVRGWPTTGLLSIDLALSSFELEEIHLFGFDFYEQDYMVRKNKNGQNRDSLKSKMMRYFLQQLINEFKDTKFVYYGSSKKFYGDNFRKV
jgi:hypothetical protein